MIRFYRATLLALVLGALGVLAPPEGYSKTATHEEATSEAAERSDSTRHPNQVPYRSNRSVVEHVLAVPAYVVHGVTRPIGWVGTWGAKTLLPLYRKYFLGPRAIFPVLTIGGDAAAEGGFVAFDNRLFGSKHSARLRAVWGSRRTNEFELNYSVPEVFGEATTVSFSTRYFNDPSREFFLRGNEADRNTDEARFDLEQFQVSARLDYAPRPLLGSHLTLEFERATTSRSQEDEKKGERLPLSTPGLGDSERLQVQTGVTIDATDGMRATTGTRVELGLRYDHELGDDRFRYGGYSVEVQQLVPIRILPETRRLVFRGRLQQSESLGGDSSIPFYELSDLGNQQALRGFENNRFSNEGLLVLNTEYRYPIWDNMDAFFFVDTGQVFDSLGDIADSSFHTSGGAGIHLLGGNGPRFRLQVGVSKEDVRLVLTAGSAF